MVFDESKMGYQSQSQKFFSENIDKQDVTQVEVESGEPSGQIVDEQITELDSYMLARDRKKRTYIHL